MTEEEMIELLELQDKIEVLRPGAEPRRLAAGIFANTEALIGYPTGLLAEM